MSARILVGKSSENQAIRIVDASGELLLNVPFGDAIN
jgi:hypothetical protein